MLNNGGRQLATGVVAPLPDHEALWVRNVKENAQLESLGSLRVLAQKRMGRPCFLIGAGPSLEGRIRDLRLALAKLKEVRPVVIAVDRAFPVLHDAGIKPEVVITIDGQAETEDFFKGRDTSGILLIAHATCWPGTARLFASRMFYAIESAVPGESDRFTRKLFPQVVRMTKAPGLVGAHALWIADYLGCDPIMFVGYDCSTAKGNGVGYDAPREGTVNLAILRLLRSVAMELGPWMKKKRPNLRLWNCSEGGLLAGGAIEVLPLKVAAFKLAAEAA